MAKENDIIINHRLVPKHTKLSDKAVKDLLDKYNIIKSQLPKILSTDPIIKLLGAKTGDIIEVERPSTTRGKAKYYRVVIDA